MKKSIISILVILLITVLYSCDPLCSLTFQNKSDKNIVFRVQENDSTNMLSYKQFVNEQNEIVTDTINIKHYYSDSILYTEIILLPDEYVTLFFGTENYPSEYISDKIYDVIINTDTIQIKGQAVLENMKEIDSNRFVFEFQTKK